jgi:hypothetical protein
VKAKTLLLASCAALLSTVPFAANAAAPMGFAGAVGAAYGQTDCDGCESASDWTLNGSGAFGFGPAFGGQVDVGYRSLDSTDFLGLGGSLFFAPVFGRVGATVSWQSSEIEDLGVTIDLNTLTYGAFGEFYAGQFFTLAAKIGGLSVDFDDGTVSDSQSGSYIGAAVIGYIMPNLALQGDVLFSGVTIEDGVGGEEDLDNTSFGVNVEYLISDMVPVSVFGGYSFGNVEFAGSDLDTNRWTIGVRFYFGNAGPTLVDKHRNGSTGWAGSTDATSFLLP